MTGETKGLLNGRITVNGSKSIKTAMFRLVFFDKEFHMTSKNSIKKTSGMA